MAGNVKKFIKNKGYESISRDMLQDVDNLSIEAIGLLSHLTSYSESWVLYKTELYTRFKKSKRTKIQNAWNELVEENYIVQLRRRNGRKYDYIYYHSQTRFTEEEKQELCELEKAELWDGKVTKNNSKENKKEVKKPVKKVVKKDTKQEVKEEIKEEVKTEPEKKEVNEKADNNNVSSTVEFQQSKMNSRKPTGKKLTIKEINYKDNNKDNLNLNLIDVLWNLEIPMPLKQKIKIKILENNINITSSQLIDIEQAYKYQIEKGLVIPNASYDEDGLNDKEFENTVMDLLNTVDCKTIKSMRAIIDKWINNAFNYKFDKLRNLIN